MAIIDRSLIVPGAVLTGAYKGQPKRCEVVLSDTAVTVFVVGGTVYPTLKQATDSFTGGKLRKPCAFWTVAGTSVPRSALGKPENRRPREPKPPAAKPRGYQSQVQLIKRLHVQHGAAASMVRWFCSSCMDAFDVAEGSEPEQCAAGHGRQQALVAVSPDANERARQALAAYDAARGAPPLPPEYDLFPAPAACPAATKVPQSRPAQPATAA